MNLHVDDMDQKYLDNTVMDFNQIQHDLKMLEPQNNTDRVQYYSGVAESC